MEMSIIEAICFINTLKGYKNGCYSDTNNKIIRDNDIINLYKSTIQKDEAENIYITPYVYDYYWSKKITDSIVAKTPEGNPVIFVPAKTVVNLKDKFKISFDKDAIDYDTDTRRPYYRLRGRRVTPEQAFDIISATDRYCSDLNKDMRNLKIKPNNDEKQVSLVHFSNWWLSKNHFPQQMGWIKPSGIVGGNGITDKYPDIIEIFEDIMDIVLNFPYLEFVVGITCINEGLRDDWNNSSKQPIITKMSYLDEFTGCIDLVISVVNGEIKFLAGDEAYKEYIKYASVYEEEDLDIYKADYFKKTNRSELNSEFVEKFFKKYIDDPAICQELIDKYNNS